MNLKCCKTIVYLRRNTELWESLCPRKILLFSYPLILLQNNNCRRNSIPNKQRVYYEIIHLDCLLPVLKDLLPHFEISICYLEMLIAAIRQKTIFLERTSDLKGLAH